MNHTKNPPLTARQKSIFEFVRSLIIDRGYGPTVREIGRQFDIKSPNGVMCHLKSLEKKGYITRAPHLSRAIQLTEATKPAALLQVGTVAAGVPAFASQDVEPMDFSDLFTEGNTASVVASDDNERNLAAGDYLVSRDGATVAVIRRIG